MKKYLPHIALGLFAAQLLLMLVSWLLSAAFPASGYHSLLSSEGLRWFLGHFVDSLSTPLLVWLVLLSLAYGVLRHSGLLHYGRSFRERRALLMTLLLLVVIVAVIVLLSAVPHAVLLSATGRLFPSPFSQSLVPVVAFSVTLLSAFYGMVSGNLETLPRVYDALLDGIHRAAPLLLFYILLMQIYESLCYVFQ